MIRSEFVIRNNKILAFSVQGHSGLAEAPHDILCASVSAMTQLIINTLQEVVGVKADVCIEEEKPLISLQIVSVPQGEEKTVEAILQGFYLQMQDLEKTYPTYLSVRVKK